jgi:ACT domain-containing protein
MAESVDDRGISPLGATDIGQIIQVNMPVDKVSGPENLHKPQKSLKTPMAFVAFVVNALWRGMGKEYIHKTAQKNTVPHKPGNELYSLKVHLKIGILVWPPVVSHGTPQPRHYEMFLDPDFGAQVGCAAAGEFPPRVSHVQSFPVFFVMLYLIRMVVPEHEKQGLVQAGNDKVKIIQRKVPGRKDQIHAAKTLLDGRRVNQRVYLVGNTKNFHRSLLMNGAEFDDINSRVNYPEHVFPVSYELLYTFIREFGSINNDKPGVGMNAIITVVGTDKVGIIARVSAFLAERNINIEDISQTILSGNFVMMMMVDLSSSSKELEEVKRELAGLGETMNVSINLMHEKVFSTMHRI